MSQHDAQIGKIRSLVAEQLGLEVADLGPDSSIQDDLGADSLDVVEVLMALEELFDIEIPDAEAEKMATLGDVESFVLGRIAA